MTKSSLFIGGCILVGSAIIGFSIWSSRTGLTPEPDQRSPSPSSETARVDPQAARKNGSGAPATDQHTGKPAEKDPVTPQASQQNTGTLDIALEVGFPQRGEPGWRPIPPHTGGVNDPGSFLWAQGWFYVNRVLVGKLPIRKEVALRAGEYEVCVFFHSIWTVQEAFHTYSGKARIDAGKKTSIATQDLTSTVASPKVEFDKTHPPQWFVNLTSKDRPDNRPLWIWGSENEKLKSKLDKTAAEFLEKQRAFNDSEEMKAFESPAWTTSNPGVMLIRLPESLGGRREVDAEQLRLFKNWLVWLHYERLGCSRWYRADFTLAQGPLVLDIDPQAAQKRAQESRRLKDFERYAELLKELDHSYAKRRRYIEQAIDDLVEELDLRTKSKAR